jgi:hypothetical protein
LHVINCIDAGIAALKCLVGYRSNKSNENYYPIDDPEIVAGDRLAPTQEKLAYCVVMMAVSGLKSAKQEKVT